jgi:uncharacterized protein involved in type VI secretion and phage assembly
MSTELDDGRARRLTRAARRSRMQLYGKYRGRVVEVGHGDHLGYLRAIVPSVYGPTLHSPWAAPAVPLAGNGSGWLMLPKVDDGVWIEFEAGHRDQPIWSGFWWAEQDDLPTDAGIETRVLVSPRGHQIVLDDDANQVAIRHADGPSITLESSAIRIQLNDQHTIVIDGSGVHINDTAFEVS